MADVGTHKVFQNDKIIIWELFLDPGKSHGRHNQDTRPQLAPFARWYLPGTEHGASAHGPWRARQRSAWSDAEIVQLRKVSYELDRPYFEALEARSWGVPHEVGGQIRLEFHDASAMCISVVKHPEGFAAGYRVGSYFSAPLSHVSDVSAHPLWTPLIRSTIRLAFLDSLRQVVAIHSPTQRVYCCSWKNGSWEADQLYVCRSLPRPAANQTRNLDTTDA